MGTIAKAALAQFVGLSGKFFSHVSPQVSFKLPTGHELNTQGSGTCRYSGAVTDHSFSSVFMTNERSMAFNGFDGTNARLPVAGERILLEVMPSCTTILDLNCILSEATSETNWLNAADGSEAEFIIDPANPGVTAPKAIQPCAVPNDGAAAGFPDFTLYLGNLAGARVDPADPTSFPCIALNNAGSSDLNAQVALLGDTGKTSDQWVLWAELSADAPANSFVAVSGTIEKPARF